MIRTIRVAALAAALTTAATSVAQAGTVNTNAAVRPAQPTTAMPSAKTRFCVQTLEVASRIPRRVCQTRAEWLNEGFDPLAPQG